MRRRGFLRYVVICCALIVVGALAACDPMPTSVVPPTLTLIIPTITSTVTPEPSATPTEISEGILPFVTSPAEDAFNPLLAISVTPDFEALQWIIDDLALSLRVTPERIRVVTIESVLWFPAASDCPAAGVLSLEQVRNSPDRISGLRYTLLVGNTLYTYYVSSGEIFRRCETTQRLSGELLLTLDPGAREMTQMAQRRVAEELDLSTRRVTLIDVMPFLWQDSSLGCPQAGQSYQENMIQGYRIILEAGGREYIFHSDTVSVFPCLPGSENLPSSGDEQPDS